MTTRLPSVKTLSRVFEDPKQARAILEMTRDQLLGLPAGDARERECLHPPRTYDIRMHCLDAIDEGLCGVEAFQDKRGDWVDYLNTGDPYTTTLCYRNGRYFVACWADLVE